MRLEKKHQEELERRKGLTGRTIVQTIWLAISAVAGYFALNYLFENDYISYNFFYTRLFLPRWVPEWAILAAAVLLIVIIIQFFVIFGYALASPEGRTRSGTPSLQTRNPDSLDDEFRRR